MGKGPGKGSQPGLMDNERSTRGASWNGIYRTRAGHGHADDHLRVYPAVRRSPGSPHVNHTGGRCGCRFEGKIVPRAGKGRLTIRYSSGLWPEQSGSP